MVLVLDGRQLHDSTFEASFSVAAHIVKSRAVAGESFPSVTTGLLAASLFDRHTKGPELVSEEAGPGRRVRRTLCLVKSHNQPFCCVAEVRAGERPLQECHTRCPLRTYNAFLA